MEKLKIKTTLMKIFKIIIFSILFIYILMLIDTQNLMRTARNVFLWKNTPLDKNNLLNLYSLDDYFFEKQEVGKIKLTLFRIFTLHNFKKGFIVIYYTREVLDKKGEILTGSWMIFPVIWEIQKVNGEWEVVKIKEDP